MEDPSNTAMREPKIIQIFPAQAAFPGHPTALGQEGKQSLQQLGQAQDSQPGQAESEKNYRPFISNIDRLRWKVVFLSQIQSNVCRESPFYFKLLNYIRLATQNELNGKENADFYLLCREAEQNLELGSWIEEIDNCITRLEQQPKHILSSFISLEEFLSEIRKFEPDNMNLGTFIDLVQRVDIHEDLLNSHIPGAFRKAFLKENILSSRLVTISLMLWKPGGCIPAHEHENSLSVIRICKGVLSHWQNLPPYQIGTTNRRQKVNYYEDELVAIDYGEQHELSNQQQNRDLLTLHFRFYRPSDDRDREGFYIP